MTLKFSLDIFFIKSGKIFSILKTPKRVIKIIFPLIFNFLLSQKIMIPMDIKQNDHLKAYGFAFWALNQNINVEWLLN